ncbi:hypothetical protein JXJ21_16785 [candidate division KSB1 bacterium]|nr:hypothetical protein [candidate division KSB1 bacterium]
MDNTAKRSDRSTWAIGGSLLIGIGAGFFFLKENPLAFVACILIGIGLGLVITSIISSQNRHDKQTNGKCSSNAFKAGH